MPVTLGRYIHQVLFALELDRCLPNTESIIDDLRIEFRRRVEKSESEHSSAERRVHQFARIKRVSVGLLIILAVLGDGAKKTTQIVLLSVPAILAQVAQSRRNRADKGAVRSAIASNYYRRRLDNIEGRWAGGGVAGNRYSDEVHPYANDLDLFGTGSVFERLCTATTTLGQDTLAKWLLNPADSQFVRERQKAITELKDRIDFGEEIAELGRYLPPGERFAAIVDWCQEPTQFDRRTIRVILAVTTAQMLLIPLCCLVTSGIWLLFIAIGSQIVLNRRLKKRTAAILNPILINGYSWNPIAHLLVRIESEKFESPLLKQSHNQHPASRQIYSLARILTWEPLLGGFGFGPQLALAVEYWRRSSASHLADGLNQIAQCEALNSIAIYARENPGHTFAEVIEKSPTFDASELCHPLIEGTRGISNDVKLDTDLRLYIVSGSNMSGKSTLLRTVGLNTILALAGVPVRAKSLRLSRLQVGATLRVQDSLTAGRSRFYAEALRVKQLLDLAHGPVPMLFLLDELFAGTCSGDRQEGVEAVAKRLMELGAIGFITTHDMEVTKAANRLVPQAVNVHFEDSVREGKIHFDYLLKPGVSTRSNGLALLRAVGIEV